MAHATINTSIDTPAIVAAAITPDNTDQMDTTITEDGTTIVTTIDRDDTGGLRATTTDYLANLDVACTVIQAIDQHTDTQP